MSAASRSSRLVATRYAAALFAVALEQKQLSVVGKEVSELAAMLVNASDLRAALANPTIARADKAAVMDTVLTKAKASDLLRRFVARMGKNGRLDALAAVAEQFAALQLAQEGRLVAEVRVAAPMTKKAQDDLAKSLGDALGKKLVLEVVEQPDLLGGIMIKLGSKLLDYSLRGTLKRLEASLIKQMA